MRRRPPVLVALALAAGLVAVGCGTRLSHERLLADARGAPAASSANGSGAAGSSGAALNAADPGASTDVAGVTAGSQAGASGAATAGPAPSTAPRSGSASSVSGSSTAAAAPGCPSSLAPLAIGSVGQQSGVVGALLVGGTAAVKAWVAATNAAGGVRCHPVKYVVADDGADPSRHQSLVQKLVEEDHVVAFVFQDAPLSGQASVGYLTKKRIPVVGSEGGSPWFYDSPMFFPEASSGDLDFVTGFASARDYGLAHGKTKLGTLSCVEVAECSRIYTIGPQYVPKYRLQLVYRGQATLVAPDYTSQCQAAQSAGAQMLYVALDPNGIGRLARSCQSVGYRPQYLTTNIAAPLSMANEPLLDGIIVGESVIPWMITTNPRVVEYRDVLRRYAPGLQPDSSTMLGWVAAKLFETVTRNLADPPTSGSVLDGLWSLKGDDLGGMTQPLTFTRDQKAPQVFCYWTVQAKGGTWVSPNAGKRTCE